MATSNETLLASQFGNRLLTGVWNRPAMLKRIERWLGPKTRKRQRRIIDHVLAKSQCAYPPTPKRLSAIVLGSPDFHQLAARMATQPPRSALVMRPPKFSPVSTFADLVIPRLTSSGELADWLGLPVEQLDWFTDDQRQHGRTHIPILQHYSYAFVPKRTGPPRLIEAPKSRMKTVQRRILREILDKVPVHANAHGFVAERSCRTGAQRHTGAAMVVTADLADFFLMTPLGRVHAVFRSLGYPHAVARCLTGLCSTSTPGSVFDRLPAPRRHTAAAMRTYLEPHLPQGAPTSPALANLVAHRLDLRLSGLARSFDAIYTRYADDMAFSGDDDFAGKAASLLAAVDTIATDEGYRLNARKTKIMRRSARQRVTGIVVNSHLNVPRETFDALKATLHNCMQLGAALQNRDGHPDFRAHLEGRIGWVESLNPARGTKLRKMFARIEWG